jgi:hypothetical protein
VPLRLSASRPDGRTMTTRRSYSSPWTAAGYAPSSSSSATRPPWPHFRPDPGPQTPGPKSHAVATSICSAAGLLLAPVAYVPLAQATQGHAGHRSAMCGPPRSGEAMRSGRLCYGPAGPS